MDKPPCSNCDDTGWVCEAHADQPWAGVSARADACDCGAPGMPCDVCNDSGGIERAGITVTTDISGDKRH
jgi:hypothetical protein